MCILFVLGYRAFRIFRGEGPVLRPVFEGIVKSGSHFSIALLCLAYVGSNVLSKHALNFVSVPMMIVFKSSKLVCVMLGGTLIMRKVYSWFEYFIALSLVSGIVSFSLADMHGTLPSIKDDSAMLLGIGVLLLALCCDSVLGNLQEKIQKNKLCDELSLMYIQSVVSTLVLLVWTAVSGELMEGLKHCWRDSRISFAVLAWALSCMAGIIVMLRVVAEFSAVTAVVFGLIRKVASIFISYSLFPKPLTPAHTIGLLMVFCSVVLHSFRTQLFKYFNPEVSSKMPTDDYEDIELGALQNGLKLREAKET